ncbi:MAG: redoxin domain-containing protein [Lentisphaerae bacterium]|nr:redoxin domain-containing protein [Lentisphaerota bacterium]
MKKMLLISAVVFALGCQLFAAPPAAWFKGKVSPQLITSGGKKVPASVLQGKMVAFYFSAHWCPPCRSFTPQLAKFYRKVSRKHNLEIVFVSSDRDAKAMAEYMKQMPWLAIPHNSPQAAALRKEFKINGIPTLVVVDSKGRTVTTNGRTDVMKQGTKAVDSWKKGSGKKPSVKGKKSSSKSKNIKVKKGK